MIATIITLTTGTAAVATPFLPAPETTFTFNVSESIIAESRAKNGFNRHMIPISLPESASQMDKLMFCSNLTRDNPIITQDQRIMDRGGLSHGPNFNGTGNNCFITVNSNMNDSENRIAITYKGTTQHYNIVYRDIDPITANTLNPLYPLKSHYEIGDYISMGIRKTYGNLHVEGAGNLPKGIELINRNDGFPNARFPNEWFEVVGRFEEAGDINLTITDLNNDDKSLNYSFKVNPKPEPEPEEEQVAGCTPSTPKNGEKIIFRYSMNRVDTKC